MSIEAVTWAFNRRGLKPAAKLVLVFLADCHNRHTRRCDPSQELLAEECEMSRSSVNVHLRDLEQKNLIKRVRRVDPKTRKQKSTYYVLGCDGDLASGGGPVSEIKTRKNPKPVSENWTRKTANPVSRKRPIPCPENGQSRVQTSGHKPEGNLKEPCAHKKNKPFFTDDERFKASGVVDHIRAGGGVDVSAIPLRVRNCITQTNMLDQDEIKRCGLG